jgi:glycosyltransferase involved in cell wall biosynthesis
MADSHITVTGRVDDVRAWLEQSRLSVVPLLAGGGTRLKILEAMAMERVVVSTRLGAEGIAAGEGLVLADTPEDMADRVAELLEDEQLSKLGKANRKRAIAEFGWKSIGQQMLQLVDKVME